MDFTSVLRGLFGILLLVGISFILSNNKSKINWRPRGLLNDLMTGVWTSCFMLLFVIATASLLWMHFAIRHMEREAAAEVETATGTVVHAFTTGAMVQVFLLKPNASPDAMTGNDQETQHQRADDDGLHPGPDAKQSK